MTPSFRGYTLIELIVAIGLFAVVTTLVSGAYIMMIGLTQQAQGMATGINNLSFALETMTRTIRTGVDYSCVVDTTSGADCTAGGTSFFVTNAGGIRVGYALSDGAIVQTKNGTTAALTDPSVTVTSLVFYTGGTASEFEGDSQHLQPYVTMVVSGTVSYGEGRTQPFTVETGAAMRGTDL